MRKGERGGGGRGNGKGHQCMTMLVMEHGPSQMHFMALLFAKHAVPMVHVSKE